MSENSRATDMPQSWRTVRLQTLVGLRWLTIAGQSISVVGMGIGLDFPLPMFECLALIVLSVALNLTLTFIYYPSQRLDDRVAGSLLAFDTLQLAGLLWLTGGLENPFALLLIAPVAVSATTLHLRTTLMLALLVAAVSSILTMWHMPLPWMAGHTYELDPLYVMGIWVSILLGVGYISAYTNRVAHESRMLADALSATDLALSRQQQLRALDGLAAAAAHELGTPLATIALAAHDMRDELKDTDQYEDADLIVTQVDRCRSILGKLRNIGLEEAEPFASLGLHDLVAEITTPFEHRGKQIHYHANRIVGDEPVIQRHVGLIYGLGNLVENAVHFARNRIDITASWNEDQVTLTIADDGEGFAPDVLARLGEPYLTRRPKVGGMAEGAGGLGLGVFIAKTLLERTGGRLRFHNKTPQGEAEITISWPRSVLEDPQLR